MNKTAPTAYETQLKDRFQTAKTPEAKGVIRHNITDEAFVAEMKRLMPAHLLRSV